MTTVEREPQHQVAPTPVGRQLPIPDEMRAEIADEITRLCNRWANRLSGIELDWVTAELPQIQVWVLAQMTVMEVVAETATIRQPLLASAAKRLHISDARMGEAVGLTEEAARRRAKRGTQQ